MTPHPFRIRDLNDALRRSFLTSPTDMPDHSHVMVTPGAGALDPASFEQLMLKVVVFDAFTPDNDPHGEHDFGSIDHDGVRYFWKIDYYGLDLQSASPDPSDPAITARLLTIMRADEY